MSGWKRENGVFVLVLARFRGLEGVRILTICGVFPSLLFKRHPECIFLRFLRFLAPFGLPLGGNFATFSGFFEHAKKNMIFERPAAEAKTPGFPSGKVGTLRGGVPTTPTAGQGLARRIYRLRPCRRPRYHLLACWFAGLLARYGPNLEDF